MKTAELTGAALDWAVAECEFRMRKAIGEPIKQWVLERHEAGDVMEHPSSEWVSGGPIIEREIHAFDHMQTDMVCAMIKRKDMKNGGWNHGYGPTPLIAAMRCYVVSKLGDDVDIPKELI